MFSKTVMKYLARAMHDACKKHEYEDIRELYGIGIVPSRNDVCAALSFNDILGEIDEYREKTAVEKYFNQKVLITFDTLLDCGVDMSEYVIEQLLKIRTVGTDFIQKILEFVIAHFDYTKVRSLTRREIVASFACIYTYEWNIEKKYINFRNFHLLVHSDIPKILDKPSLEVILTNLNYHDEYESYASVFSVNSVFKTFVASVDEDDLLRNFPRKEVFGNRFSENESGAYQIVETTFAIDILITS